MTKDSSSSSSSSCSSSNLQQRSAVTGDDSENVAIALFCGEHCEYGLVTDVRRLRPMAVSDMVPTNSGMGARRLQSLRVAVQEARELLKGAIQDDDDVSSSSSSSSDDQDSDDSIRQKVERQKQREIPKKRVNISKVDSFRRNASSKRSKYTGVFWHRNMKKWQCSIRTSDGKDKYLGVFLNELDAARRYDKEAPKHGKSLNLPDENIATEKPASSSMLPNAKFVEIHAKGTSPLLSRPIPQKKIKTKAKKPVLHINGESGEVINEYPSAAAAGMSLGIHYTMVGKVCNGRIGHARGLFFRWKVELQRVEENQKRTKKSKVSTEEEAAAAEAGPLARSQADGTAEQQGAPQQAAEVRGDPEDVRGEPDEHSEELSQGLPEAELDRNTQNDHK